MTCITTRIRGAVRAERPRADALVLRAPHAPALPPAPLPELTELSRAAGGEREPVRPHPADHAGEGRAVDEVRREVRAGAEEGARR